GPFLPPITFPWITNDGGHATVVSAELKQQLEALDLPGVSFREARKSGINRLHWERWDLQAPEPPVYPKEGEPEEYVMDQPHDPTAAEEMSTPYELIAPVGEVKVRLREIPRPDEDAFIAEGAVPASVP